MPGVPKVRTALLSLLGAFCLLAQEAKLKPDPLFQLSPLKGVDFVLRNSPTPRKYLIETMPGGVALLDYNNDGLLDIFLVNAGHTRDPMRPPFSFDRHDPAYWNRLYRQNKDGSFTDVTEQAGLANAGDTNYGMGVAVGDYDNDGFPDIYVTNYGKNILYHNNGDGTFTDVTAKAGVAAGGWSVSAGFLDYDNDGKLDLFVSRYLDWSVEKSKTCGSEKPTYCPPGEFGPVTNILYHNRGDGTFEDVSVTSGIAAKKGKGLGVAFADYDGDGFTDIFVTNDVIEQFLFHNNGDGTFTEVGLDSGAALTNDGKMLSGMGVVFQDYDNDGLPDLLVTQLPRQPYVVFHNDSHGAFSAQELETGFGTLSGKSSGWGVGLEDFDNDGWKDAFIVQGHVFVFGAVFLGFCVASLALVPLPGSDLFPYVDAGQIRLHFRAPTGLRIEETSALCQRVEQSIRQEIPRDELNTILDNVGMPYSGINLTYSNSGVIGTFDAEISSR